MNPPGTPNTVLPPDGDLGFIGVEMRYHPSALRQRYAASAVNMRFTNLVAETRKGSVKLGWMNKISAAGIQPWGTIYGRGTFVDAANVEWQITAADGNLYASRANNPTVQLTLPAATTVTQSCFFTQAAGTLVLHRGLDADPLELTDLRIGFVVVPPPEVTQAGLSPMPRALKSIWLANRLWVQTSDDQVWASDLLDIHTYSEANKFTISSGNADPLVTIIAFGKTDIICLKRHSVYRLTSIVGDLSGTNALPVTRRYGCLAARSAVDVGTDLIWLSDEGIASLHLTELGELQAAEGKLNQQGWFSDPIEPLIKRINGAYAQNAVATIWNRHLYMAVPLDAARAYGPELLPTSFQVSAGSLTVAPLVVGKSYLYRRGSDASLTCGSNTYTSTTVFTATATTATINGIPANTTPTASVKLVTIGINNAILVYNYRNQAWSGHDESDAWDAQDLFHATFVNKDRLFLAGADGWITLYEETWEDQMALPYLDLTAPTLQAVGNTLQVNGGDLVYAVGLSTNPHGLGVFTWGVSTLAKAQANLFTDELGFGGCYAGATGPWSAPNTAAIQITGGVRFYGTNGVMPVLAITGTWASITYHPQQPIQSSLITRGYLLGAPLARKRTNDLTLQIQTWSPTYTVSILNDGVSEEDIVATAVTRDRTLFTQPFNAAAYDQTNSGDNFLDPHREDYSVVFPAQTSQIDLGENGIQLDLQQEATLQLRGAQSLGRTPQIKILNTTGRIQVLAAGLEGFQADQRKGTFA